MTSAASLAWAALAAALLLAPGPAPDGRAPDGPAPRRMARGGPARAGSAGTPVLRLVAAVSVGAACVALLGPLPGAAAAAVLVPSAAWAVGPLVARTATSGADRRLPLCLDLVAAGLGSGLPLPAALELAAPAASPAVADDLGQVATLLRLGADPVEAWRTLTDHPELDAVARIACRSAHSGARLARTLESLADRLRAEHTAQAVARAHRAGVQALAPLGLCFLPAFLCLGVVPVVVGVARTAFGALP